MPERSSVRVRTRVSMAMAAVLAVLAPIVTMGPGLSYVGSSTTLPLDATLGARNDRLFRLGDGTLVYFYRATAGATSTVSYVTSDDAGETWSSPSAVAPTVSQSDVSVAQGGGSTFYVAHVSPAPSNNLIRVTKTAVAADAGGAASPATTTTTSDVASGATDWFPSLSLVRRGDAAGRERLAIAFDARSAVGGFEYQTKQSDDSGETWSLLPSTCEGGTRIGVLGVQGSTVASERLLCITVAGNSVRWRVWSGVVWGQALSLPAFGTAPSRPSLVKSIDEVIHAVASAGTPPRIFATSLALGSTQWTTAQELGPGADPVISTAAGPAGVSLYAFGAEQLSSFESWIRPYAKPADSPGWVPWNPLSGRPFDRVFDYNAAWNFRESVGDGLFALNAPAAGFVGNALGSSITVRKLDAPTKKVSLSFVAPATATATDLRIWVTAGNAPTYRVGLQSDAAGQPDGVWIGSVGGLGGAVGTTTVQNASASTMITTTIPQTLLSGGQRYHVVIEPIAAPLGANDPSATRWMAVAGIGAEPWAGGGLQLLEHWAPAWTVVPNEVPRFAVAGPGGTLVSQPLAPNADVPVSEFSVAGESFVPSTNLVVTSARVFLRSVGTPTTAPVLRLLSEAGATIATAALAPTGTGWVDGILPDVQLAAGSRYRLVIDDPNFDQANRWSLATSGDASSSYAGGAASVTVANDRPGFNDRTASASDKVSADRDFVAFNSGTADVVYVGSGFRFDHVALVRKFAGAAIAIAAEYWNGSNWASLSLAGNPLGAGSSGGAATFAPPAGWTPTTVNGLKGYWVRLMATGPSLEIGRLTRITNTSAPTVAASAFPTIPLAWLLLGDQASIRVQSLPTTRLEGDAPTTIERVTGPVSDPGTPALRLRSHLGTRYAGQYLTGSGASRLLVVRVKGLNSSDHSFVAGLPSWARDVIRLADAAYSDDELEQFASTAHSALEPFNKGTDYTAYSSRYSYADNRLEIAFGSASPSVIAAIEAAAPAAARRITVSPTVPVGEEEHHPSRSTGGNGNYVGGLILRDGNSELCSANFIYREGTLFDGATAGHCDRTDSILWNIGGWQINRFHANGIHDPEPIPADAALMRLPNFSEPAHPEIYVYPGNHRRIVEQSPEAQIQVTQRYCLTARSTGGGECGLVLDRYANWPAQTDKQDVFCVDITTGPEAVGGDSGGAWYDNQFETPADPPVDLMALATGIHVGGFVNERGIDVSCFQTVGAVETRLNAEVWIDPLPVVGGGVTGL